MTAVLTRQYIKFRYSEQDKKVEAHVAAGIGIVAYSIVDQGVTDQAYNRWLEDGDRTRAAPGNVLRNGFVLAHAESGYVLTPIGWLLPDFDAAKTCVRDLIGQFGTIFEGPVRSIQLLGGAVLAAHRHAGAFTGRHHHLRLLDAQFDEAEYQRLLTALRAERRPNNPDIHDHREAAE